MTVTVWGTLQLEVEKVTCAGLTRPSASSLLPKGSRTSALGMRFSTTVKVVELPVSLVTRGRGPAKANPGSLSRLSAASSLAAMAL